MTGRVTVVGLGAGSLDRTSPQVRDLLLDPRKRIFVRTLDHPAANQLSHHRDLESADRLYDEATAFEDVYVGLAEMVVRAAEAGDDVVLAVPGSPLVAERTTRLVRQLATDAQVPCEVMPAESFIDLAFSVLGFDPLDQGVQILDGRSLPEPLNLAIPTLIAQVDVPAVMTDVADRLRRLLPEGTPVLVLEELGTPEARRIELLVEDLAGSHAGPLTTVFIDAQPVGWSGLVHTMRRLRDDCPWDAQQTHESLVSHIIEEAYELVDAIGALSEGSGAYGDIEEELGDLLLQVLFQSVIARQQGAFDIDDVVETIRRKLHRRHPHVFGDADVGSADEVYATWEQIKADEKPAADSLMDGLPRGLPALQRAQQMQQKAARVGFDWGSLAPVVDKVREETEELAQVAEDPVESEAELGDLLFAVVNLARHLGVDPEVALRRASGRFEERFRRMEGVADLTELDLDQMDHLWNKAKDE